MPPGRGAGADRRARRAGRAGARAHLPRTLAGARLTTRRGRGAGPATTTEGFTMRIKGHGAQGVTLDLTPADCLYLARACGLAGNCACEADQQQLEGPFDLGAAYFEALALVAFAY